MSSIKQDLQERWEITGDTSLYLSPERVKQLNLEKSHKAKIGQKLKILDKVATMIEKLKKESDIPKLEEEWAKYLSIIEKEQSKIQAQ